MLVRVVYAGGVLVLLKRKGLSMKHVDENISNRALRLDGEEFHHCSFQTCTLEIAGTADLVLEKCTFTDCQWVFVEAAATTLAIMAKLHAGMILDGDRLIEQVFDSIRQGSGFGTPYRPVS
jgi:hypothetical protein